MSIDLLIKNGKVVNAENVLEADVAIKGGKVVGIGNKDLFPEAKKTIDAEGKLLFPGGIDPHTHFETPFQGAIPYETWEMGTKAAAIGGTTTVIKFTIAPDLLGEVDKDIKRAGENSVVDFAFHGCFIDFSDMAAVHADIPKLVNKGIPSIKEFMVYRDMGFMVDDWMLFNILDTIKKYNGIVGVHAENDPIGEGLREQYTKEGKTHSKFHPITKPNFVESEAIQRACSIAEFAEARMYIAHMSSAEGVKIVAKFQERGTPIFSETCTHYLTFTDKRHGEEEIGIYSLISPPLRKEKDIEALWWGLNNGVVSMIGSDHAPFGKKDKMNGFEREGFKTVPNGAPGVLERMPVVYNEGVNKNRISLTKMAQVTSTNCAKMLGLYPRKGLIAPGSDADIVIFDPDKKVTLGEKWYEGMDWTPYEGMELTGFPEITLIRGEIVAQNGEAVGKAGYGEYIERTIDKNLINSLL